MFFLIKRLTTRKSQIDTKSPHSNLRLTFGLGHALLSYPFRSFFYLFFANLAQMGSVARSLRFYRRRRNFPLLRLLDNADGDDMGLRRIMFPLKTEKIPRSGSPAESIFRTS